MTTTGTDKRTTPFLLVHKVAVTDYNLTPFEGWLYIVIVSYLNSETGIAFPSMTTLSKRANMSRPQVIRCIKTLEKKGLIEVTRSKKATSKEKSVNNYALINPNPEPEGGKPQIPPSISEIPQVVSDVDCNKIESFNNISGAKKTAPDDANKPPKARSAKQQALDAMKNAIAEAFGLDHDKVTGTQWQEFGRSGSELLRAGATPNDMKPLHQWCVAQKWKGRFTSLAMSKNWANFARDRASQEQTNDATMGMNRETAANAAERSMYQEGAA